MITFDDNRETPPPASLQQILDNERDIHEDERLDQRIRHNIALYLRAFHLDVKKLDDRYDYAHQVVNDIQNSSTYRGFVCALERRPYEVSLRSVDGNHLDYKIGYDAGLKLKQRRRA